jgi:hypothetical protein
LFIRLAPQLTLALLIVGCSSGATPPASPLSIVGSWTQGARLQETARGQTHIHSGYFSFARRGDALTGSGQQSGLCDVVSSGATYAGPLANGATYQISSGVQSGTSVNFVAGYCTYRGLVSSDGADMSGTATCSYDDGGSHYQWSGDWLAHRER